MPVCLWGKGLLQNADADQEGTGHATNLPLLGLGCTNRSALHWANDTLVQGTGLVVCTIHVHATQKARPIEAHLPPVQSLPTSSEKKKKKNSNSLSTSFLNYTRTSNPCVASLAIFACRSSSTLPSPPGVGRNGSNVQHTPKAPPNASRLSFVYEESPH